jgi:hypothetical protein
MINLFFFVLFSFFPHYLGSSHFIYLKVTLLLIGRHVSEQFLFIQMQKVFTRTLRLRGSLTIYN